MLRSLSIYQLRNLHEVRINLGSGVNYFLGKNGAGKTATLEAIYLLSQGRSFRTISKRNLITAGCNQLNVKGTFSYPVDAEVRLEIDRNGRQQVFFGPERIHTAAEMGRRIFCLSIYSPSKTLFDVGPEGRRSLVDWMVFHAAPQASNYRRLYEIARRQSNQVLNKKYLAEFFPWAKQLSTYGEKLNHKRHYYFLLLVEEMSFFVKVFPFLKDVELSWSQGWSKNLPLLDALMQGEKEAAERGYLVLGAHRADIKIKCHALKATESLSKGQTKALALCLYLAAYFVVSRESNKKGLILIDDLSSDLHRDFVEATLDILKKSGSQIFVSDANIQRTSVVSDAQEKVFHVEHGKVYA